MDPLHDDNEGIGFPLENYYQPERGNREMANGRKVEGIKEKTPESPLLCEHDLEPTGEEYLTQLDNISRLTRFVKCKKCGQEALDVFVYIGTFQKGE